MCMCLMSTPLWCVGGEGRNCRKYLHNVNTHVSPSSLSLSLSPSPFSVDPAIVGKAFVKQYYTQMHKDPSQMHRFYLDQSSFVHGGAEMGSEDPVIGQKVCLCVCVCVIYFRDT